jgi:dTDP-4-dehydrorhamnose reductase
LLQYSIFRIVLGAPPHIQGGDTRSPEKALKLRMLPVKILLFGSRGQVGWELQRALSPLGELVVADRGKADFEKPEELAVVLGREAPNIIVNAVAYTAVDQAETDAQRARLVNAVAVERLARAALAQNALLIHYSTDYVFDGLKSRPYSEDDPVTPMSIYGRTKSEGEEAIFASGCDHLILRTSWVHSSRRSNFVRKILRLAADEKDLTIVADQFGAPTGAELIADVTALAVARHTSGLALGSGVYHLTAGGAASWYDFARYIVGEALLSGCDLRARPETIKPISSSEFRVAAPRPRNSLMDTSKLSAALNIVFPDWTHHARRTIAEIVEK